MKNISEDSCFIAKKPELLREWSYEKNAINPYRVSYASHKKYWWICYVCGNQWHANVKNRISNNAGCPYCANKKACKSNCLATINPEITKDWDYQKNVVLGFSPENILANSHKSVWWKCYNCGYEWKARIDARNYYHNNCIGCRSILLDKELKEEWHIERNKKFLPNEITIGSRIKVWWKCRECGNEWKANIKDRYAGKYKCFKCNSLGVVDPILSQEWDDKKNYPLTVYDVSYSSGKKRWWKCRKCNRGWEATVASRYFGNGCSACSGVILKDGFIADSKAEAIWYLKLKKEGINFISHKKYGIGWFKCDFYLPDENKYLEITSYNNKIRWWDAYIKKIADKKEYVEKILCAKFEFIQYTPTYKDYKFLRENMV